MANEVYQQNVLRGWWDDPDRSVYRTLQLVNTEIAEATEGDRKGLMDDHLRHRKMAEVEMADTVIRLLDMAGRYGWEYKECLPFEEVQNYDELAEAHLWLTAGCCYLAAVILKYEFADSKKSDEIRETNNAYSMLISSILFVSKRENYDLENAISEKLEYNKKRADHSRENRNAFKGKKY